MKYLRILLLYSQHVLQYRTRSFIWFLISFLNPFILLMFWDGALEGGKVINGWNAASMQTYYLLVIVAQSVLITHVENEVAVEDIRQGNLVRELLKPIDYLWLKLSNEISWRFIQGFYGLVVLSIFLLQGLSVQITSEVPMIIQAIIIALLALTMSFMFKMILGILAFWMTDIYGILEPNDVFIIMFSGTLMPFDLLPEWIRNIAQFTPYPYLVYYPVAALMGRGGINFFQVMTNEIFWIVGLFALYRSLWFFGVKRFSGVGQ